MPRFNGIPVTASAPAASEAAGNRFGGLPVTVSPTAEVPASVPDLSAQWTPEQRAMAAQEQDAGNALFKGTPSQNAGAALSDTAQAIGHHLANLPLGLAQLVGHGLTAVADSVLPAGNSVRQQFDATRANFDKNMAAREAGYQAQVPTNAATVTGAAAGEIAPWLVGIGELRAAGMLPQATTTLGKLGTLAAEGGAMGAAQPVNQTDDYASTKAKQIVAGAATGPALEGLGRGVSGLVNGAKGVVQHIANPQAVADANVARLFGADPANIQALRSAPTYVTGETPSAAQVLATPDAVQAERMLRTNPASATAFVNADNANNAVRQAVVQQLAGNDATMQAAKAARRQAVQPFIDQSLSDSRPISRWTPARNFLSNVVDKPGRMPAADFDALKQAQQIASKVRGGSLQEDDALEQLQELADSVTTKKARDAFEQAFGAINRNMVDPSGVQRAIATIRNGPLGVDPRRGADLDAIMHSIDRAKNINGLVGTDMLDQVRQQTAKLLPTASDQSKLAYGPAINSVVDAIDNVAPGYRDYLATYAKHSEPINTMEAAQKLLDPNAPGSLNAAGDPQLAISRLRQVLRGDDKARYPMSDAARAQLNNVRESLQRRGISDNKIGPSGSNTASDLQAQSGLPAMVFGPSMGVRGGVIPRVLGGSAGAGLGYHFGPWGAIAGSGLGGLISDALGKANQRVIGRIGQTAASAPATADALARYIQLANKQPSLLQQMLYGSQATALPAPIAASRVGNP